MSRWSVAEVEKTATFNKIPICLGWSRSPGSPGGLMTCTGCLGCPGRRGC